jgi:predicted nicotinamide N-methyase
MDKLEALTALRDKVKAGDESWVHLPRTPELHTDLVWKAWSGSLDAAKALHDAVLPGWFWSFYPSGGCYVAKKIDGKLQTYRGISLNNPARAWLIAVLEALIAQEPKP